MIDVLGIDNVLIGVGDLNDAVRFYGDVLGLPLRFRFDEAGIALFSLGDEEPGLLVRHDPDAERRDAAIRSPRMWLEVPDARQAADVLTERGARLLAPPFTVHTGWTVEIADPWGNVVGLTDYTLRPEQSGRLASRS